MKNSIGGAILGAFFILTALLARGQRPGIFPPDEVPYQPVTRWQRLMLFARGVLLLIMSVRSARQGQ